MNANKLKIYSFSFYYSVTMPFNNSFNAYFWTKERFVGISLKNCLSLCFLIAKDSITSSNHAIYSRDVTESRKRLMTGMHISCAKLLVTILWWLLFLSSIIWDTAAWTVSSGDIKVEILHASLGTDSLGLGC